MIKVLKNIIEYAKSGNGFGIDQLYKNFLQYCKNNSPANERIYIMFGLVCLVFTLYTMFSVPSKGMTNEDPLFFFYQTSLMVSVLFSAYPMWPATFKNEAFVHIFWNIGLFYVPLVCMTFFALLSKFAPSQNIIFLLSMIGIASLIRWQIAVIMIPTGVFVGIKFYEAYSKTIVTYASMDHIEFRLLYIYLPILFVLTLFFLPKPERPKSIKARKQQNKRSRSKTA
jgi:hypothetical protein